MRVTNASYLPPYQRPTNALSIRAQNNRPDRLNDGKLRYPNNPDLSLIPAPDAVII